MNVNGRAGVLAGHRSQRNPLRRSLALLAATLREIFDESAYDRFLARRAVARSRASYLAFLEENSAARERRPRCC